MNTTNPPVPSSTAPLLRLIGVFAVLGTIIMATSFWFVMRPVALAPTRDAAPSIATVAASPEAERALELTTPPSLAGVAQEMPRPIWIWADGGASADQTLFFRRIIEPGASIRRAELRLSADNHAVVRIGDEELGRTDDWQRPGSFDITNAAQKGAVDLRIEAHNDGGPAGLLAMVLLETTDGRTDYVLSDQTWSVSDDAAFTESREIVELGTLGIGPWGELPMGTGGELDRSFQVLEGFTVELVYGVPGGSGSWVCLTADEQGRLVAAAQYGGLYRVTPAPPGSAQATTVEALDVDITGAQGLLVHEGALYCMVSAGDPQQRGLYRLTDTDGDDAYDTKELVRAIPNNGGEHGPHAIALGPDGLLYVVAGNHVPLPQIERSTVPRVWQEDHLLPRLWDARGHAVGILAPGGWIARLDPAGGPWELVCIGFRNCYDLAFDARGELFTYDADMEWDMGAPWYRPTRLNHVVTGADFGWRSGTAKWPPEFPDSLPATLDIGPGSPTGVVFGYGAAFPERYQQALYLLDWTYGTMYAVHLEPDGASYTGISEVFLTGRPLPLTDAVINPADGAMYFTVGGRGLASALYRVRHLGGDSAAPPPAPVINDAVARRRALEAHHHEQAPASALELIWPALDDPDRFVRHAARIALEHQAAERWIERATTETNGTRRLQALLALARTGGADHGEALLGALASERWGAVDEHDRLTYLRALALCFIRNGAPDEERGAALARALEPAFPAGDAILDRVLVELLVYLDSPVVVGRTLALMERPDEEAATVDPDLLSRSDQYGQVVLKMAAAPPQRQQVHYALALCRATAGWNDDLRTRYFRWFDSARRAAGGLSFTGFLDTIRDEALAAVPEADRARYANLGAAPIPGLDLADLPRGPGRAWRVDDVVALLGDMNHRNFERGAALYRGASCSACHRLSGAGGLGGPDLTGIGTRFSHRDLIETIIEPSREVSDQYRMEEIRTDTGTVHIGRVVDVSPTHLTLMPSLLTPTATIEIERSAVTSREPSLVSPMMANLLDQLAPGEVLDLLAYMLAGGDPRSDLFVPADAGDYEPLFDGRSLRGWKANSTRWDVVDGAIVGRTTAEDPLPANEFLVLRRDLPVDVEIRAEVQLIGDNNSGIQYRSSVLEQRVVGKQCDIHPNPPYHGMLYEEGGRGIVVQQGERLAIGVDGTRRAIGRTTEAIDFRPGQWHEYTIIARGKRVEHRVDGTVTCVLIDEQSSALEEGDRLALQLHAGKPYEVRFRNLRFRRLGD